MPILHLNNIYKDYGDNRVLAGVSLVLQRGEKVGWWGPTGAGKPPC